MRTLQSLINHYTTPAIDLWVHHALYPPTGCHSPSPFLVFTGPVHWTEKKTEIELNPTAKDQTTSCSCTNSEIFQLPVARFVEKSKNRKKTGLLSRHVLDLTHAHIYLIYSLWIISNSQELVEIWPKTFLYATWIYVPSVFAISQPNLNKIA